MMMATSRRPIDEASGESRREASTNFWVAGHARNFLGLLGGREEIEFAVAPQREDSRGRGSSRHQGTQEDIGVDYEPHRLFVSAGFGVPMSFFANAGNSFVNQVVQFFGRHVSEGGTHLIDGLIEQAPFDGIFNEPRKGAFFEALSAKMGTQGQVGAFGPDDRQTREFSVGHGVALADRHIPH